MGDGDPRMRVALLTVGIVGSYMFRFAHYRCYDTAKWRWPNAWMNACLKTGRILRVWPFIRFKSNNEFTG